MANRNGGFIGTDGLDAPDPPTAVTPTAGDQSLSIAFTAPTDTGTSAITGFVAQVSTDGTAYSAGSNTGTSSPIVVSSLSNGTSYTAKVWAINAYGTSAPSDASSGVSPDTLAQGFIFGGNDGDQNEHIDRFDLTTAGNATDFGDLNRGLTQCGALGGATRCLIAGGYDTGGNILNTISYITVGSTGSDSDFGDLTVARRGGPQSFNNTTRGVFCCGRNASGGNDNVIDYVTIASTGNATDFGDALLTRGFMQNGGHSNGTRGIFGLGEGGSDQYEYVTIASTGNATDFGDALRAKDDCTMMSNTVRGITAGGVSSSVLNEIEYITIASTGNATDFGNLTSNSQDVASAASATRGIISNIDDANVVDQIQIPTTGNATDFGDMTSKKEQTAAASNKNGGLG